MSYAGFGMFYLAFGLSVLGLEIALGRHRGIYTRADWLVNLLCAGIGSAVARPLLAIALADGFGLLLPGQRNMLAHDPVWVVFAVMLLVDEFLFYWVHRLSHQGRNKKWLAWLWKLHRTHHSGKYMTTLLVFRINPVWTLIQPPAWVIAFTLYMGQPMAAALLAVSEYAWNVITHSNFRWDDAVRRAPVVGRMFRLAEHVFVSPGLHHTHHGFGKDGANYRNFGFILSVFDTLFGTLHVPQGRPWRYGLPGKNPHWSEEVFYPLVRGAGRAVDGE